MKVTLHISAGPESGRRIDLRSGLTATIGRSEWSDFSIEEDKEMADVHFVVRCMDSECHLELAQQTHITTLNGEAATASRLHTGDRLYAGTTEFVFEIDGDSGRVDPADAAGAIGAVATPLGAAPLATYLDLDEGLQTYAEESETDAEFLGKLVEAEEYQAACRVQAHLLDARTSVWWGCLCLEKLARETLAKEQLAAFEAASAWANEPEEENRRVAERAARDANYSGPSGTLAAAVFFSGGSLAPPNSPEPVAPDERLTGQCVAGAILLAAVAQEPERLAEKLQDSLEIARDLVDGKIEVPSFSR